jgi:hypothetical protein
MPEYIPKARTPDDITSYIMQNQGKGATGTNIASALAEAIGKVGDAYFEGKNARAAASAKAELDQASENQKNLWGLIDKGYFEIDPEILKADPTNPEKAIVRAYTPEERKAAKETSVSPDSKFVQPQLLKAYNQNVPPSMQFDPNEKVTVAQYNAGRGMMALGVTKEGQEQSKYKFGKEQIDEAISKVASLNIEKAKNQSLIESGVNPEGTQAELDRIENDINWYYNKPELKGKLPPRVGTNKTNIPQVNTQTKQNPITKQLPQTYDNVYKDVEVKIPDIKVKAMAGDVDTYRSLKAEYPTNYQDIWKHYTGTK